MPAVGALLGGPWAGQPDLGSTSKLTIPGQILLRGLISGYKGSENHF